MKTIVIVLYQQELEECLTFQSLQRNLFNHKSSLEDIEVIIYDNSPEKQQIGQYGEVKLRYVHDERNSGICAAYNYAWTIANENKSEWLLLLDHDTEVTEEYIDQVIGLPQQEAVVAAVVPRILTKDTFISPVYANSLRPLQEEKPGVGIQDKSIMAINSGALIRVDFLNKIKGFNNQFPLDYLDHWLFHEIYANGYVVSVLNTVLQHDLSVMDYTNVSLNRYKSILDSEINFYRNYKKDLYPAYKKQLMKRIIKQLLVVKNKKIALYSLNRLISL